MKKLITFVTAASLTLGSIGVTAYASVFTDIKNVPWAGAATFVDEAYSIGLMNGYLENGKRYCKAKNNVTYCEAVQLVYSIMKTYEKSDVTTEEVTKWTQVMSAYNIPSWAHSATAYCLENSIIEASELTKLANGTQNATREDVGVFFGKAMEITKQVNNSASLSYKDKASVTSAAVPYLALLNDMKIMVGDENNNFNPKAKINRAEMAVLSVKSYKALMGTGTTTTPTTPSSGTVKGTVTEAVILTNGDLFLSFTTTSGAGLRLFGKEADVKVTYDGEAVTQGDIGKGDTLTITYNGTALKTVVIDKSVDGVNTNKALPLKSLTSKKVTVTQSGSSKAYTLASKVKVTIAGKSSSVDDLIDEMEDDNFNVTLTFDSDDEVTKIEAIRNADNPLTGRVSKVTDSNITIKVGSSIYTYTLADDDVSIKNGSKTVSFTQFRNNYSDNNYTVTLALDSKSKVTKITIDAEEDEYNGTLSNIKTSSKKITIKANGKSYEYPYDADVTVKIDGKTKSIGTLKDNYDNDIGYTIALAVDKDDVVTRIDATAKGSGDAEGVITDLDSSKIRIKVDGSNVKYTLGSSPTIKIDGKTMSMSNLKKYWDDYEFKVTLTLNSSNKVTAITGKNTEATKGMLKTIETKNDEITIEVAGISYTYDLDDDVTAKLDGKTITLSKLDKALDKDKIEATLTIKSGDVTVIKATTTDDDDDDDYDYDDDWPEEGILISVNKSKMTITIEDDDDDEYTYKVKDDVTVSCKIYDADLFEEDEDYYEDEKKLKGVYEFLYDCDNVDCLIELDVNNKGYVTKIYIEDED